jgi:hypothetical protein
MEIYESDNSTSVTFALVFDYWAHAPFSWDMGLAGSWTEWRDSRDYDDSTFLSMPNTNAHAPDRLTEYEVNFHNQTIATFYETQLRFAEIRPPIQTETVSFPL